MKLMSEALGHKRLRAPADDGGKLIVPPLDAIGETTERNAAEAAAYDYDVQGRSLVRLAREARAQLVETAWCYTQSYRDVPRPETPARLFLAGHQPQLFHPGVWFKNFVLSKIAEQHSGVAVNLAIDSDTIKSAALRVPTGSVEAPLVETVPYDRPSAEIPYESREIVDHDCLASFGKRAAASIRPLVGDPLLCQFWPLVVERAKQVNNLGECIAQARHQQEGLWGANTLELPQSQVCNLPAFHWFACHLFARLPQLWDVYNSSVAEYRQANHVRSSAHPVPDLALEDGWLEAPFWIWDAGNPHRRRLFVRQRGEEILLSDRAGFERALLLSPEGDAGRAAEQLAELAAGGVRLRTRALITTLFARLFLSDLFLHGIGGAKYDQVTDAIIERFFGLKPPQYMTLTATLRLPIRRDEVTADDARRVDRQLRELAYHPERHLASDSDPRWQAIVDNKRRWVETVQTRENARQRGDQIRSANAALQPLLADAWRQVRDERERIAQALRVKAILASREYAFCLYPAEALKRLMDLG